MATRNRTLVFIQFRTEKRKFFKATDDGKGIDKKGLLEMEDLEHGKKLGGIPPAWMSLIDEVNYDISRIKAKMNELAESHKNNLLPQEFDVDRTEEEQTVEILTEHITKMFQQAQIKIQRIGGEGKLSEQEKPIKKNVQSALATQLQELSVQFRKAQKDYLQRLRGRQQKGKMFSIDGPSSPSDDTFGVNNDDDANFKVSFTASQQAAVLQSTNQVDQRVRDIQQIAKSINDLAMIFKDLATLVIEQGTILDRIDYNIEQTQHNVDVAVKNLVDTKKMQTSYGRKLCMLLLCIGVMIMVIVVLIKYVAGNVKKNSSST